mgnify:FL=1
MDGVMNIKAGELFNGRYRLVSEKGRGAFGDVWLAHDEQIDLDVAIKIYISLDDRGMEDFKSEYKNAFSLNHPNLLHAYYFDVVDNRPFLVMPYCPGSAESLVGCTDETTMWRFIRDVASGLEYLHSKNILHRDIKPDNILSDADGNFLITDFGVSTKMKSTLRRNSTRMMSSSYISGTVGYMAPELFTKTPDAVKATDIWAFGATLYEIINGELPFFGQGGIMLEHGAEIPALKGVWSDALVQTVEACLAKDTWARPTAGQLSAYASKRAQGIVEMAPWQSSEHSEHDKKSDNETVNITSNKTDNQSNDFHNGNGHCNNKKWKLWLWSAISAIVIVVLTTTVINHGVNRISDSDGGGSSISADPDKILIAGKYDNELFCDFTGGVTHLNLYKSFSDDYEYYNKPSWCKIYTGSNVITVICELNKTQTARSATVYFRRKGHNRSEDLASLTITQNGNQQKSTENKQHKITESKVDNTSKEDDITNNDDRITSSGSSNVYTVYSRDVSIRVGDTIKAYIDNGYVSRWEILNNQSAYVQIYKDKLTALKPGRITVWGYVENSPKLFTIIIRQ